MSQIPKEDSLLILIKNSNETSQKIKLNIKLILEYGKLNDFKNKILVCEETLKLATEIHNILSTIIALTNLGKTYLNKGLNSLAINNYLEALNVSELSINTIYINKLYGFLGLEYSKDGNLKKGLRYLKKV